MTIDGTADMMTLRLADGKVAVSRSSFRTMKDSLMDTYACLDGFPGTEGGFERVLEALRVIEEAIAVNERTVDELYEGVVG